MLCCLQAAQIPNLEPGFADFLAFKHWHLGILLGTSRAHGSRGLTFEEVPQRKGSIFWRRDPRNPETAVL